MPDKLAGRVFGVKDALTGSTLELDAIAGPILRAAPGGAPATRAVVAEISRAQA